MIANVSAKSILESQWISDIPTLWAGRGGTPEGKRLNCELAQKSEMFVFSRYLYLRVKAIYVMIVMYIAKR